MDAEKFDLDAYLAEFDVGLLKTEPEYRRAVTETEPLLFALLYRTGALTEGIGEITLADFHLDLTQQALRLMFPCRRPKGSRDIYIAPRNMGKSTWLHNILPLWAAAHGHIKTIAGFANSAERAKERFGNFKSQLDRNELLRLDYPGLCTPMMRRRGVTVSDTQHFYRAANNFSFAAFGVDGDALGMNIDDARPDLIILDDVELDEGKYTEYQRDQRLATIRTAILPMNDRAHVTMVGTSLMPNSLIHQAVKSLRGEEYEWIQEEKFRVHHYKPILLRADGSERSCWPAKWTMDDLNEMRGTRDYRMTFDNDPMAYEGAYWSDNDIRYGQLQYPWGRVLSIDPATTTRKSSNFTGIATIEFSQRERRCAVVHAEEVHMTGAKLRERVVHILNADQDIRGVVIETNQGGENWRDILHHLPVQMKEVHQSVKKEARAARLLTHYQRGRVIHAVKLPRLEERLIAYRGVGDDDLIDAVGTGVEFVLAPRKQQTSTVYQK